MSKNFLDLSWDGGGCGGEVVVGRGMQKSLVLRHHILSHLRWVYTRSTPFAQAFFCLREVNTKKGKKVFFPADFLCVPLNVCQKNMNISQLIFM